MFTILIALLISLAAAGLIYFSWRARGNALAATAGWVLAFGSAFAWSQVLGPEIGTCYAFMIFVCLIWLVVIYNLEPGKSTSAQRPLLPVHLPSSGTIVRHSIFFLLSVPVSGVTTLLVTVTLVIHLPWSVPLRLAVGIFAYPLLWGGYSAWICAHKKLLKPAMLSVGLLTISSLILFI